MTEIPNIGDTIFYCHKNNKVLRGIVYEIHSFPSIDNSKINIALQVGVSKQSSIRKKLSECFWTREYAIKHRNNK